MRLSAKLGALAKNSLQWLLIAILATMYIVTVFQTKEQKKLIKSLEVEVDRHNIDFAALGKEVDYHNVEFAADVEVIMSQKEDDDKRLNETKYLLFRCQNELNSCKSFGKHDESEKLPSSKTKHKKAYTPRKNLKV